SDVCSADLAARWATSGRRCATSSGARAFPRARCSSCSPTRTRSFTRWSRTAPGACGRGCAPPAPSRDAATWRAEFVAGPSRALFTFAAEDRVTFDLLRREPATIRALLEEPALGASVTELREDLEAAGAGATG